MSKEESIKKIRKLRRTRRVRRKILARSILPRLSVFRSNKFIYAQIIDDNKRYTLASASDKELARDTSLTRIKKAEEVGKTIAKRAKDKKIKNVVFDKGSYRFHGRVKALAEAARSEGLIF